jgi:putative N6-adenine-specific DNA methylase
MMYQLFLIIPPGLEDLALEEVELKCPRPSIQVVKGGLELEADLNWIITAHCTLKIPTRILMRLSSFRVRDFPKLFQKLAHFKWNTFLSHPEPQWQISASQSRLNHTGRIEEVARSALRESLARQPLSRDWEKRKLSPQTFYIRIHQDQLTLGLDLSGDPLYKRGLQTIKGEAPLRENFAAAFIFELLKDLPQPVHLIDPMCGSGTLLTEALSFFTPLHLRSYSFEEAPFFKGVHFKLPSLSQTLPIESATGFDLNGELLNKVKNNLKLHITLIPMDSLKEKLCHQAGEQVFICNPPYGERLSISGKRGSFLKEAWMKFLTVDGPLRLGWITPSDMDDIFTAPTNYELLKKRRLRNGGLAVSYWIWQRKS